MTGQKKIEDIDVMVIPRILLPLCAVNGLVEVLNNIFGKAYASYRVDDIECTKIAMIDSEYQNIFKRIKQKSKKKNHIYITEMPFFIVMHRIEVSDNAWYYMIQNTIKLVGEGHYDAYDKERALAGGVVTASYNMKKFEKKLKERSVEANVR